MPCLHLSILKLFISKTCSAAAPSFDHAHYYLALSTLLSSALRCTNYPVQRAIRALAGFLEPHRVTPLKLVSLPRLLSLHRRQALTPAGTHREWPMTQNQNIKIQIRDNFPFVRLCQPLICKGLRVASALLETALDLVKSKVSPFLPFPILDPAPTLPSTSARSALTQQLISQARCSGRLQTADSFRDITTRRTRFVSARNPFAAFSFCPMLLLKHAR